MNGAILEAKAKLPLPALMHRIGLDEHAKKSGLCPFHDDHDNSWSIYKNDRGDWRFKCFAGCGQGDEITFLELYKAISKREATKLFLEMAGVNGCERLVKKAGSAAPLVLKRKSTSALDWRACVEAFTQEHLERLAKWRGYSIEFCRWLKHSALVGLYDGCIAFPLHDRAGNVVAAHYRLRDGSWRYPQGAKVSPLVIGELVPGERVHCFESTWDGLDYLDKSGDLLAAMLNAEVVHEAEQSWTDALNAAIVTSNELHELKLVPRKKLLGDWFCEGDLGFIFAFRGVGKTWLALAIAQALSSGGKLGDWQADAPVKVLYIDGEMPPHLIRSRCKGLEEGNNNLQFLNHEILFERSGKMLNITNREIQEAITKKCIASGVKVVFLDNLSTLASGMRENEADSWELVNSWLLDLRRRKIAVVIVHHAGRSGEMRGTSKREDNVFWIIALDDAKKNADDKRGARFISRFTKPSRNTQEELPAYEWHFVTDNAIGEVSISHQLAQTMDVFLGLIEDGVRECNQIAQEMKTSPPTISRLAKRAMDAGKIIKKNREYFLAEGEKFDKKS